MATDNILLLETVSPAAAALLRNHANVFLAETPASGPEVAASHNIHAIVTRGKGDVSPELIDHCPQLRVIARCGVGLDNVAVDYASGKGIPVVNAPGSNADTVAEHTLGLMLSLQRRTYASVAAVKAANWAYRGSYGGDEIRGKTLGILGFGNIGRRVGKLAEAFGVRVVARERDDGGALADFLAQIDILTLHLPLTEATHHLIGPTELAQLPDHALVINTARGGIVDEAALYAALREGRLGGYAADVLATEPPAPDNPLLQLSNVLVTPHAASLTARTYNQMCVLTCRNALDLLAGKSIDEKYIFNR